MLKNFQILLIFIFISFCFCCNSNKKKAIDNSYTNCINNVIAIDDSLGTVRNHASETISLSNTIHNYTASIEKIDFSNCPEDFENAFKLHVKAWNNMTVLTDKYPHLRAELHDVFDSIHKQDSINFKPLLDDIWNTWSLVEDAMKQ